MTGADKTSGGTDVQRYAEAAARAGKAPNPSRFERREMANPLYRCQLAHARLVRTLAQASQADVVWTPGHDAASDVLAPHIDAVERALARTPYAITRAIDDFSNAVLIWVDETQFWPADPGGAVTPEHETCCATAERSRIVLSSGLAALGITAHERI